MSEVKNPARRLRIAHLFQAPGIRFSESQAAQLHIFHTMRALQEADHDVALLALIGQHVLHTRDLHVFHEEHTASELAPLGLTDAPVVRLFERAVRRTQRDLRLPYMALFDSLRMYDAAVQNLQGFDVIHERFNLLAIGGALASRRLGIPLVLEVNADLLEQRRAKGKAERGLRRLWAEWTTRYCFESAAMIVTVSAELGKHLQRKWNVPADRLAALPCAADTEVFGLVKASTRLRKELGLNGSPVIMWVGGFHPWHDLSLLVDSFAQVRGQLPGVKLVLVGDGETRPEIQRQVARKGMSEAVIMTGMVSHGRIPEFLSLADVVVSPSPALPPEDGGTGTPLKLFEYMAAGKAIVATAVNQASTVIDDGHTGLLVPPSDREALASAIIRLLQKPVERAQLAANARKQAEARHSWRQYSVQLVDIYRRLLR